jgi:hypothetical protein
MTTNRDGAESMDGVSEVAQRTRLDKYFADLDRIAHKPFNAYVPAGAVILNLSELVEFKGSQ